MYPFHLQAQNVGSIIIPPTDLPGNKIFYFSAAQHLDLRFHSIPFPVTVCLRVRCCADDVAMGLWCRHHLRRPCLPIDSAVRRGNVRGSRRSNLHCPATCACRMYDRGVKPIPEPPTNGLRYRVETLLGITGLKMVKYRDSWSRAISSPFRIVWRPQLIGILVFEVSSRPRVQILGANLP